MKPTLRAIAAFVFAAVLLSYLTNYDYLWGGIRETWLRGWENAQIDDLSFPRPRSDHPCVFESPAMAEGSQLGSGGA